MAILFRGRAESEGMSDENEASDNGNGDEEEKSFRERVEEIREKRAEEGEEGEPPESPFGGGGGPGGMGGGGNPFAQMMGGMMGGGPGGMGGGPGGRGEEEVGNEELVREVRQLRDEMRDQTRALKRIADALEDN
ncbi:hypothetical protein RBH26_20220 [Natronolimnohabitans sp. A-GB9]|uniref:hypothetical protein n=1 Tax=Natronolimnohabitans sp. A-GB9 TaxID=3069757 RepID=UPI0027B18808|nr:hypothetical protein [Natronolimnohabitans sp. A-GB9]MDQ2052772.1 hypothetical protein [Natronolimnohabitans sp. A-GB9]